MKIEPFKIKPPKLQDNLNFRYVYHESIGMQCEDRDPTPQQRATAFAEAKAYVERCLK